MQKLLAALECSAEDASLALEAFESLRPREKKVLELRFGFNCKKALLLREIGNLLRISKERTRQVQNCAMGKMRCALCGGDPLVLPIQSLKLTVDTQKFCDQLPAKTIGELMQFSADDLSAKLPSNWTALHSSVVLHEIKNGLAKFNLALKGVVDSEP